MNAPTNLNHADASAWEIVAQVGADNLSKRPRWTVLRVYFTPHMEQPFVAETLGMTTIEGEENRVRRQPADDLTGAIHSFERGSAMTEALRPAAQRWQVHNEKRVAAFNKAKAERNGFQDATLGAALDWLYPDQTAAPQRQRIIAFEQDFGIPMRTVQHILKAERDGSETPAWIGALLRSFRYFNRDAWMTSRG